MITRTKKVKILHIKDIKMYQRKKKQATKMSNNRKLLLITSLHVQNVLIKR